MKNVSGTFRDSRETSFTSLGDQFRARAGEFGGVLGAPDLITKLTTKTKHTYIHTYTTTLRVRPNGFSKDFLCWSSTGRAGAVLEPSVNTVAQVLECCVGDAPSTKRFTIRSW